MSVVMNLYYTGQNGSAKRFVEEMETSGIANQIRQMPGNERYDYFLSISSPETVLLVDVWHDQTALDEHHASSMMNQILSLRQKYSLSVTAERFISDEKGIPEHDRRFLDPHGD